ncbi:MAG: Wzz/FepE/Etk N-terminal domain-containing protein [Erysipelotrichaceae bacterium]|nr:Wzz/FepE/Etk N-terminal domain-containing protein [Erysipelotrichaceae bacterium]
MNQATNNEEYIDLLELAQTLLRKAWIILLIGFICGAAGYLYSTFIATPLYNASAMMIVNSGERDYVTQDQLNSAKTLAKAYNVIITSDTVMDQVISNLRMKDTYDETVHNIEVTSVDDTQIIKISVTATDPQIALRVCREITNVAPEVIVRIVKAGSVELVSKASTSGNPVSPRIGRNTALGFLLGVVLTSGVVVIITLTDNKVKGENEFKQLDLPLLGVIPNYENGGKR